jgi:alpha-galactosidase
MKKGQAAKPFNIDIKGIRRIALYVSDAGDGIHYDHADWVNVRILYFGDEPEVIKPHITRPYVLTPSPSKEPRINGPQIYGANAGNQLVYKKIYIEVILSF